jgi:hypothetical protein
LVAHFASGESSEKLPADRYFQAGWVKPQPMLDASPGEHQWIWDMRRPRPRAVSYGYTIAAVWGLDTPLDPRGQFVEPGQYSAILTVDGRSQQVPIDIEPDPRVINPNYHSAREFSESLYEPMELAWRGYAETEFVKKALAMRQSIIHDPSLLGDANALKASLAPSSDPHAGFEAESGTLAALETSAESSDTDPTAALREAASQTIRAVNADWSSWQLTKSTTLAAFNRRLSAARLQPIEIPPEAELKVDSSDDGVDLP